MEIKKNKQKMESESTKSAKFQLIVLIIGLIISLIIYIIKNWN